LASDPTIAVATASAASAGICHVGAALCAIGGAFASGFVASELKSRMCRKRKFDQLLEDVTAVKEQVKKQEVELKVAVARTRGRFRTQRAVLAGKADAATVAEQLGAKVDSNGVDSLVASKVDECLAVQQQDVIARPLPTPQERAEVDLGAAATVGAAQSAAQHKRARSDLDLDALAARWSGAASSSTSAALNFRKRAEAEADVSAPAPAAIWPAVGSVTEAATEPAAEPAAEPPVAMDADAAVGIHCATDVEERRAKRSRTTRKQSPGRHTPEQLLAMYPDRIPVICKASEPSASGSAVHKLLLPRGMSGRELKDILIKRVKRKSPSPFMADLVITSIMVDGAPLSLERPVAEAYGQREDKDSFLEVMYSAIHP